MVHKTFWHSHRWNGEWERFHILHRDGTKHEEQTFRADLQKSIVCPENASSEPTTLVLATNSLHSRLTVYSNIVNCLSARSSRVRYLFLFIFGVQLVMIDKGWGFGGDLLPSLYLFLPRWLDLWLDCVCSSDLARLAMLFSFYQYIAL